MSVHIAHKLIYGWFLWSNDGRIIGRRETVAVFCFYSSHGVAETLFCINMSF